VEPLRDREEFVFVTFPEAPPLDVSSYVRLGIGGKPLSPDDANRGLLLLDGTWRLAARMEPFYSQLEVRSLPPIQTAYPRKSAVYDDPQQGLATIEALYAGLRILGRDTESLLDQYHWKDNFLTLNGW
jgi:pre-rRNA-processing protein TSR3